MAKGKTEIRSDLSQAGANLTSLLARIKDSVESIESLKDRRADINAKINEVRTALHAEGIPKKALDMAMQYMNMDVDKRQGFDLAYTIVREAIGLKMQPDLFDNVGGLDPEIAKAAKAKATPDAAGIAEHLAGEDAASTGSMN